MAEFPGIPKDYLTVSFLQQLKEYIDDKAAEGGGGGGGVQSMAVHITATESGFTVDKTWKEIYDALQSGVYVYPVIPDNLTINDTNHFAGSIQYTFYSAADELYCVDFGNNLYAETDNENGYPNGALS